MLVLKALRFAAGFGVARALLFVAPILLANILPLDRYGQFELAQSFAAIGALLLGAGLPATVPLLRLREEIEGRWDTLLLMLSLVGGGCLLAALITAVGLGSFYTVPVLVLLGIGTLIFQGLWAISLKSDGKATQAVFVEAGFWSVAVVGAGLAALSEEALPQGTISFALLAYGAALLALTVIQFRRDRIGPFGPADLYQNVALGLPLMFTSILTVLISSSGRLVLGNTSGAEVVGVYAVIYRCTVLPLVGHQILIIGFFRQIFSWSEEVLRRRAAVIVVGVAAMALAFWALEPYFGWVLGERFVTIFERHRVEGLILLVQTVLWSAVALNDLINARLQIAGRVALVTGPFLVLGLGLLGWWTHGKAQVLGIEEVMLNFVLGHMALMIGYYAVQCGVAWFLGHRFVRLWSTTFVCAGGAGALIFFGERIQ